ncbi:hypothetical protein NDU88_003077 [Pleurodeles waltl]|uniref:Uncharacterized protein n=1 Tax=Pleurodeles waltl TaxID=8319 RepID=A0AAV7W497_PLEWA|nr:hypothetical protein NDU88_003077 [Pleurodeles waltl]
MDLHGSATPNPEGQCELSNPLVNLGAEGQSQGLRAAGHIKPELEEEEGEEMDGRRERSSSTAESFTGRRGDTTDDGGAEAQRGDPESSTSGAGGAQREFRPRCSKFDYSRKMTNLLYPSEQHCYQARALYLGAELHLTMEANWPLGFYKHLPLAAMLRVF